MDDANCHNADCSDPDDGDGFEAALTARYRRLSLLTLDLAEEAGEAARDFSFVDRENKTGRFERRIAAMTRAIWAHRSIESLRRRAEGGAAATKAPRKRANVCTKEVVCSPCAETSRDVLDEPEKAAGLRATSVHASQNTAAPQKVNAIVAGGTRTPLSFGVRSIIRRQNCQYYPTEYDSLRVKDQSAMQRGGGP